MRNFQYLKHKVPEKQQAINKSNDWRIYAKMEANHHLSNKYALFYNMTNYYRSIGVNPFDVLPLTFHIRNGTYDEQFFRWQNLFKELELKPESNIWIVKPGEDTNRGVGISVCSTLKEIK
jgi:tubulin--tyrosine ligase